MTTTPPRRVTAGHEVARALMAMEMLGTYPKIGFRAIRGTASHVRRSANEWLSDKGAPFRVQVYRTNPYSMQTHTNTEWEACLVRKDDA